MSDIDIRVRDELHALADEAPAGAGLWAQTQDRIRVHRRHRRLSFTALATVSAVSAVIIALTVAGGSPKKATVTVEPTIPNPTIPTTPRRNTPTTVPHNKLPRTPNGPLSQALQAVVRPLLPYGAQLTQAYDLATNDPPAAFANYLLPSGQTLRFVRQRFTTFSPGDPRSLITDSAKDSLTTLATGSRLLKLGHGWAQQVLLIRPNGTVINVVQWAPQSVTTQPSWHSAFSIDSLAVSVVHDLDRPSSDVP
ncbi:MAG: hypothetical protein M3Q30_09020 [Actinomycetota bacterium]|nr:hypothetical protein [Actinomycetota bacterium]